MKRIRNRVDNLKAAVILGGQVVGRSHQDHIVFKLGCGDYDVCNPKITKEPVVRYLKYTPKNVIVSDEKGKEIEKISLEKAIAVEKVGVKKNKPPASKGK